MSEIPKPIPITCEKALRFEVGIGESIEVLWINGEVLVREVIDPYITKEKIEAYAERQNDIIHKAQHKLEVAKHDEWWAKSSMKTVKRINSSLEERV